MTLPSSPTRRLTLLYLTALTSIALLSIVGQIIVQGAIQQQKSDAFAINIAGRQRMLSQQISKNALFLEYSSDTSARATSTQELQTALASWKQVHEGLQHGDTKLGLPAENSTAMLNLYQSIQPDFTAIDQASQDLLSLVTSRADAAGNSSTIQSDVQTILSHEKPFLSEMNAIVGQLQSEAEDRISTLHILELILLGITLAVLAGEALFVFRPATTVLRQTIDEIVTLEKSVAQQKQELESGIDQLLKTHVAIANGDFQTRAPLSQDHVLWQIAYSLNNLLARFHSLLQIEANTKRIQIEATQAVASSQAQATRFKEELKLIHDDMMHLTAVIRDAKTRKHPVPVVPSRTVVGSLTEELGGSYVYPALPPERQPQDSMA